VFQVSDPEDLSGSVRFGFSLGNMKYSAFEVSAPTCTSAIVGGQGTGVDSYMIERLNLDEHDKWGRYEKYVARAGTTDAQLLQDDGDRELASGASTRRVTATLSDTPLQVFGVHYNVGSIVSLETRPGESCSDQVRTVHIQAYATAGEYVSATVGSQAAEVSSEWSKRIREIDARVGRLERNVTPA
jgi:hypothetical protein